MNISDRTPTLLTADMLDQLASLLLASGAVRESEKVAGISPSGQVAQLEAAGIDCDFTEELTVWWEWMDGLREDYVSPFRTSYGGLFIPLPFHAASYHFQHPIGSELLIGTSSTIDQHEDGGGWFPIGGRPDGLLRCECGNQSTSRVRLTVLTESGVAGIRPAEAPSLGSVVKLWIEAFERGTWRYDKRAKGWETVDNWPELPTEHRPFVFRRESEMEES